MTVKEATEKVFAGIYHITDAGLMQEIQECATIRSFKKGEVIHRSGDRPEAATFLLSGVARTFFTSGKGEELTDCFLSDFGFPAMTPNVNLPILMTCEAVSQVEMLVLPTKKLYALMETHTQLLWAYIQMLQWTILFQWQIKTSRMCFDVWERYAWFRETFPEADREAYRKHIAAFLGMTPETLSRIRKSGEDTTVYPVLMEMKTEVTTDDLLKKMKNGLLAGKRDTQS